MSDWKLIVRHETPRHLWYRPGHAGHIAAKEPDGPVFHVYFYSTGQLSTRDEGYVTMSTLEQAKTYLMLIG
jgi:hypothetical protein